jgi:hypothetical protein
MKSLFISILIFVSISAFAQNSKEDQKEARYQAVIELVNTQKFEFIAKRANPPKIRSIDLTTNPNFLRIDKEKGAADIPYFGRSFSGGYSSNDGGIKFDGPFESYDVQMNDKKRRLTIKFKVHGEGDTYTCTLNVPSRENVSLTVLSNNRQTISYTGFIQELKAE